MTQNASEDEIYRLDSQVLSDLWIFRSAARLASITAAAKRLGVTQGAVSQRIQRLEARLSTPLFRRHSGGLALTGAGEALLEAMNSVAVTLNGALGRFDRVQRRTLVVSCLPSLATEWLVPRLSSFNSEHPDIELFIRAEIISPTPEWMEDEGIDIMIDYRQDATSGMGELASVQELIIPVCSRGYLDVLSPEGGVPTITRLHDYVPWVGGPRDFEWSAWTNASPDWHDRTVGERHFNLAHLAYHAALCGQGVAIGRAVLVNRLIEHGELIAATSLPPVRGASYRIMSNRPGHARSPARRFAEWLVAEMDSSQKRTLEMVARVS